MGTTDEEFLNTFEEQLKEAQELNESNLEEVLEEEEIDNIVEEQLEEEELFEDEPDPNELGGGDEIPEEDEEEDPELPAETEENLESPFTGSKEDTELDEEEDVKPAQSKSEVDLQEFHDSIMKPFKANGKMIELRNPEEAVQLMKMGANYTQKMQEISRHRKTIATLHEHGIESEAELAFLIDLKNKDPEAIKKYFKDSEIDPFDIDTSSEVNYKPKAKMVSESTIEARSVLEELNSTPKGAETLNLLADTWDDESTAFMWSNPQAFKIIHEQRESGAYDQIMAEIERQTTLGILQPHGSILEKYNIVGNQLFGDGQPENNNTRKPIDTRVASRSSAKRSNKSRARAASSPRASKRTSMVLEDLAELDDDAFLEAMNNRL